MTDGREDNEAVLGVFEQQDRDELRELRDRVRQLEAEASERDRDCRHPTPAVMTIDGNIYWCQACGAIAGPSSEPRLRSVRSGYSGEGVPPPLAWVRRERAR